MFYQRNFNLAARVGYRPGPFQMRSNPDQGLNGNQMTSEEATDQLRRWDSKKDTNITEIRLSNGQTAYAQVKNGAEQKYLVPDRERAGVMTELKLGQYRDYLAGKAPGSGGFNVKPFGELLGNIVHGRSAIGTYADFRHDVRRSAQQEQRQGGYEPLREVDRIPWGQAAQRSIQPNAPVRAPVNTPTDQGVSLGIAGSSATNVAPATNTPSPVNNGTSAVVATVATTTPASTSSATVAPINRADALGQAIGIDAIRAEATANTPVASANPSTDWAYDEKQKGNRVVQIGQGDKAINVSVAPDGTILKGTKSGDLYGKDMVTGQELASRIEQTGMSLTDAQSLFKFASPLKIGGEPAAVAAPPAIIIASRPDAGGLSV